MGSGTFQYMCIQIATLNEHYEQQSTHLTQNEIQMNLHMHMKIDTTFAAQQQLMLA